MKINDQFHAPFFDYVLIMPHFLCDSRYLYHCIVW